MLKKSGGKPSLFFIYLTIFINLVGFGMVFPLLPYYAAEFQASEVMIGFLAASFALAQFLFSPFWGSLSDRVGRKPIISIALLGLSVSFLVFAFAHNLTWLFISRFLQGVFSGAALPVAQAYVADITSKEERIKGMGNLGGSLALGFIFGPAIGGLLSTVDISFPFLAAGFVAIINFILVQVFLRESLKEKSKKLVITTGLFNFKRMFFALKGEMGALFILIFLWSYALSNNQVAVPLLGYEHLNLSAPSIGLFFSGMGVVSALIQMVFLSKVTRKIGEHKTAVFGLLIMAVSLFLMPFSPVAGVMATFMLTVALGSSLARPTITTLISKGTDQGQGAIMGVSTAFESFGRILGPLLGGWLYSVFGYSTPFTLSAALILIGLFFVIQRKGFLRD